MFCYKDSSCYKWTKYLNVILREVLDFENSLTIKYTLHLTHKLKHLKILKDLFLFFFHWKISFLPFLQNLKQTIFTIFYNLVSLMEFVLNQNFVCFNNKKFIRKSGLPFSPSLLVNNYKKILSKTLVTLLTLNSGPLHICFVSLYRNQNERIFFS